jgi:hypothetical protein
MRKEVNTMTYTRPEVVLLGNAVDIVQISKTDGGADTPQDVQPAYELDE